MRLLGALLTAGGPWRRLGIVVHLANGAFFGAAFSRMGGGGWRHGLVAAELENLGLWPTMAVVDRIHPDRRSGSWPPLVSSPRVFAYEVTMHALFGVVLGLLHPSARNEAVAPEGPPARAGWVTPAPGRANLRWLSN